VDPAKITSHLVWSSCKMWLFSVIPRWRRLYVQYGTPFDL